MNVKKTDLKYSFESAKLVGFMCIFIVHKEEIVFIGSDPQNINKYSKNKPIDEWLCISLTWAEKCGAWYLEKTGFILSKFCIL